MQEEPKTHARKDVDSCMLVARCFDTVKLRKAGEYVIRGKVDIKEGIVGLFEPAVMKDGDALFGSGLVKTDIRGLVPIRIWTFEDGVRLKKRKRDRKFFNLSAEEWK